MEKKIALLHSLQSVNAAKAVEKVRYYSSDAHVNAMYFRLGVATVIQRFPRFVSCQRLQTPCVVCRVSGRLFLGCVLFEGTATSTQPKLPSERKFGGVLLGYTCLEVFCLLSKYSLISTSEMLKMTE